MGATEVNPSEERRSLAARLGIVLPEGTELGYEMKPLVEGSRIPAEDAAFLAGEAARIGCDWIAVPAEDVEVLPASGAEVAVVDPSPGDDEQTRARQSAALEAFVSAIEAGSGRKVGGIETESHDMGEGRRRDVILFRMH